jgi:hypothetical protein
MGADRTAVREARGSTVAEHLAAPRGVDVAEQAASCLNCDTPLAGPFCAACGQRALPPRPTMRELVEEAWQEFVSVDGRLLVTLRLLLTRPGALTTESLAGRRARFLGPLRLYLLCSVAFFFADAVLPRQDAHARRAEVRATSAQRTGVALPESCRPPARREPRVVQWLGALDCKTDREPARFAEARRRNVPRLMFVLLPLFAGIVALAFRGHTYPEHLYFALHLHAFAFLALLLVRSADLLPGTRWEAAVDALVALGASCYAVVALRRIYARPWAATLLRTTVIGAVYAAAFALGMITVVIVTAAGM